MPLALIGGDPGLEDAPASVLMGHAAGTEFGVPYAMVPGTTHFLQIERPVECGALTREFFGANAQRFAARSHSASA